ncbi:hexokinase-2-like [Oppia nitens]|uniref:hexokinase-2-like n=1 Tax=Oppia nitens TaxID=1686743 RepID=UPI0023DB30E8|nr:hexokinase-2-like [Oppia nitens]
MSEKRKKVDIATRDLVLSNDQLEKVVVLLEQEFNEGLKRETNPIAAVKMFPTFVRDVPNGREAGKFLALDLGGTNFRVLLIELNGKDFRSDSQIFAVPQHVMLGSGQQLFDHIAACLQEFMDSRHLNGTRLPLGFTFSFPCRQEGLTKARLVQWTKGFACRGVEGQDVVQLLRSSISKIGVEIDVMAVVNDTTGTLMSCAHKNAECRVGVIVGTGTNACYMESADRVELLPSDFSDRSVDPPQVVVNTEWGAFGDNGVLEFVRTDWDDEVDTYSLNKGRQLFEKMISGMYMGEMVRSIVADLTRRQLLLSGVGSQKLFTPHCFQSAYVSWIESDPNGSFAKTRDAMKEMDLGHADDDDMAAIQMICERISTRAAHLVSAAVATILRRMRREYTVVGVDGSVYRFHPHFHDLMAKKIAELTPSEFRFDLMLSEDGSGRGAALVAAVAVRQIADLRAAGLIE